MRKKICAFLLSFMLIFGIVIYAKAEGNETLETPSGLAWKAESTATAKWNEVEGANYYLVNVYVYDNENTIGIEETGTASTEIDLQQEINSVLANTEISIFKVSFKVTAMYIDADVIVTGDMSNESPLKQFEIMTTIKRLETPTNVSLGNNYIISWDKVDDAEYYQVEVIAEINGFDWMNSLADVMVYSSDYGSNDRIQVNVESGMERFYYDLLKNKNINVGDVINFKMRVCARRYGSENEYSDSRYSDFTTTTQYSNNSVVVSKLSTPTNVTLDNNYNASWDEVKEADYYEVEISAVIDGFDWINSATNIRVDNHDVSNGKIQTNVLSGINSFYRYLIKDHHITPGDVINFRIKVNARMNSLSSLYIDSDGSERSRIVQYSDSSITISKLATPTNVKIDNDYNLSWDKVIEADYYEVEIYSTINGGECFTSMANVYANNSDVGTDGKIHVNILNGIKIFYNEFLKYKNIKSGDTIELYVRVCARMSSQDSLYRDSDRSPKSSPIYYNNNGSTVINKVTLSPNEPVVAVGRSLYIGKTIEPETALYSTIKWTTSDSNVVSINSMGKITGVKKGNATITAKINNASQTANVSVYEIETNLSDSESSQTAIDTANDIIENIIGDNDTTGTDITNINNAISEIENGAKHGNKFGINVNSVIKNKDNYNQHKDAIVAKHSDMIIGSGYDVTMEISYKDNQNNKHHIGNIVEFEKDIKFEVDVPNNLPALETTKRRVYKLMRLHNGKLEDVEMTLKNNKMKTKSNSFSDFIVLYKDIDLLVKPSISISKGSGASLILNWNSQVVDKYVIYRSTNNKKWTKLVETTDTTYTNKGLSYGTTYYYKIKACDDAGCTGYSNTVSKKAVPDKVNNIRVTGIGQKSIKISWDKVPVTGYEVYMNNKKVATISKNSTLSYTKTKLSTNKTYSFKVRAYKTVKGKKIYGAFSNTISALTAPATPKISSVGLRDYNALNVNVKGVSGAIRYEIVRSTSKKGTYTKIGELPAAGTYVDNNLNTGTTYYYKVRACNKNNNCTAYSSIVSKKVIPLTPKGVTKVLDYYSIKLNWNSVNGADGYEIQRSTNKKRGYKTIKTTTELEFNNTKLSSNKTYYYKIRAYRLVNGKKIYSSFTGVITAKTKKVSTNQKKALDKAKSLLKSSSYSKEGLLDKLVSLKHSVGNATFAVNYCGANWNDQALKKAKSYLVNPELLKEELISQLQLDKFTDDQINYALSTLGM